MPKPPYPISGDPIPADWGTLVTDYASEAMRYVRNPAAGSFQVNGTFTSGYQLLELTQLPANDPTVYAADVMAIFRCLSGGGQGQCNRLFDYSPAAPPNDNNERSRVYWTGVNNRGGNTGGVQLIVGGVNNRQIWYRSDVCDANSASTWLIVYGWWIREIGANSAFMRKGRI